MHFAETLFWIALFLIFYNYIGYAFLLSILIPLKNLFGPKSSVDMFFEPDVTLVIAAYNEADFIEKKIENCFELDYPDDKLHLIFITDGSTDDSPLRIARFPKIRLFHQPERAGKTAAINRVMQYVQTPIVIFCDANTLLNEEAIRNIVKHYVDPQVGGVAGEKKILTDTSSDAAGAGEGLYWKYESWLKQLDSDFYSVVGAAGELFSIRTSLFERVNPAVILDDFIISLKVAMKGYRVIYEPTAYAIETPSSSMREEQKRKIRISAGGFQSISMLKGLFNIFKYRLLSFQYLSHRVLRWTITPLCLPVIFILNCILAVGPGILIYKVLLTCQLISYCLAFIGLYFAKKNIKVKVLYALYYFLFMNFSVYLGFLRYLKKEQSPAWEKASREKFMN